LKPIASARILSHENRVMRSFAFMRLTNLIPAICVLISISPAPASEVARAASQAARRTPVVDVFESCSDAVVNISCKETINVRDSWSGFDSIFEDLFDMPGRRGGGGGGERQLTRTSVGSGFVIHPDGYIITNAHVIAQTAERKAIFADGREYEAEVIAFDTTRDLAVLKIKASAADGPLHTLKLGRSDDLMIGETVIAIGNPLGFQHTVTAGVVSATNRNLDFARGNTMTGLIQTDASINPGNSGGPLLNVMGELIGINTAIRGDAQNIGFAIPVDRLREVLPDLLDIERRYRVVCGISVDTLNAPRIISVQPDSPADRGGVKNGDIIKSIDGKPIREGIDFSIALIGTRPRQTIALELERNGKAIPANITLGERPAPDGAKLAWERFGIEVQPMPQEAAEALGLESATGLIVSRIEPGSPADRVGVAPRDVLLAVGRHGVETVDDLGQLLETVRSGESVPVTLLRVDRRTKLRLTGELLAR
jgi:serine protease Do